MRVEAFKKVFFDREAIFSAVDKAVRKNLSEMGGYIRRVAVNSIRAAPYGTSAPAGQPPYDHLGAMVRFNNKRRRKAGLAPVKLVGFQNGIRNILYGFEASTQSVIVGPAGHGKAASGITPIPLVLERGGISQRWDGTPIRIAPHPYMAPALAKSLKTDRFMALWRNSVKS